MKMLFGFFLALFSISVYSQEIKPLVVVNGCAIKPGYEITDKIPVDQIESVTTLHSKDAIARYGAFLGSNGMVLIKTKFDLTRPVEIPAEGRLTYGDARPLFVVDGKTVDYDMINKLNPESIGSMQVIKNGVELVEKYGLQGLNGVILVTSK